MADTQALPKELLALSAVLGRPGWTPAALKRFLPRPCRVEAFPTYARRYYRIERIEAAERTSEWTRWQDGASRRSRRPGVRQ